MQAPRNPRIDVGFADAGQSFVGVNRNHKAILCGAVEACVEQNLCLNRLPLPYHVWRRRPQLRKACWLPNRR